MNLWAENMTTIVVRTLTFWPIRRFICDPQANAKASPKEETTDLSYLHSPPDDACPREFSPGNQMRDIIIGIIFISLTGLGIIILLVVFLRRKRRERKAIQTT